MKQDWFTVERLDGDSFAISEYGHREETHSYLLLGAARALLIDAGLGIGRIGAVVSELTALPVTAAVTHVHWDHIGGLGDFERIAVHENELQWLKAFPLPRERVRELVSQGLRRSALPEGFDLCAYTPCKIVHIFFYTLHFRPILAENRRLGRDWGVKGEQKVPAIGYKA